MSIIVYSALNSITGKRYVGWTSRGLQVRWKQHIATASLPRSRLQLSVAIRTHGSDCWILEVLEEVIDTSVAKEREKHWIAYFKCNVLAGGQGYNMTDGGDGVRLFGAQNPNSV